MPKVSVIIPIYGVEKYIERCADSLFAQTLSDMEFIFVDDCTPDSSMELLNKKIEKNRLHFAEKHWQVRTVRMPTNSGLPAVRRHGIQLATGDYLIHCDSDDWPEKDMYEALYTKAIEGNYDIVFCDYYRSSENQRIAVSEAKCLNEVLLTGPLWNKLVKRSICVNNHILYPSGNKAEDGVLMVQYSYYSTSKAYVQQPLYNYYVNVDSITQVKSPEKKLRNLEQEKTNTDIRIAFLEQHHDTERFEKEIAIWKYNTRMNILSLMKERMYYDIWRNTYPELDKRFYVCKYLSIKARISYLLRRFRILR